MQKIRRANYFQTSLLFKKHLHELKANGQHLRFNMYWLSSTWTYKKANSMTFFFYLERFFFRLLIQTHAQFDFLDKGLGLVSPPHFVYAFFRKIFIVSYYIDHTKFVVLLPLLLAILSNMCIVIVSFPVYMT